jgi:pyruvyl transferase EpsO
MPDMAHQLAGEMGDLHDSTSPRPNYILRRDMETNGARTLLGEQAAVSLDWVDAMSLANKTLVALFYRMAKAYGSHFLRSPIIRAWFLLRDSVIEDGKKMILKAPVTYTDRLHVMILSLLLERPVHVFDNSYGKVRTYYETWLQGNPLIECDTF